MNLILACLALQGMEWRTDYDAARAEARDKGRLILLHFTLKDRPLCKSMDEETFSQAEVVAFAREKFVCVRLDAAASEKVFEATVGGRGGLATCVVDPTGDVVSARSGFADPKTFRGFLEKADQGYAGLLAARKPVLISPNSKSDLYALGEVYRGLGSLRRSEECYLKVVELAEKLGFLAQETGTIASSYERVARFRIMRGKNLEARLYLEHCRKLDSTWRLDLSDRILLTEALTLAVERKHLDSARVLEDALKKHPSSAEADHMMYTLGFVLHQAGQDKPALEALESAVRRFPESSWAAASREQIDHIKNPQPDHQH